MICLFMKNSRPGERRFLWKAARNVPSVVCCSGTHGHRFVNAIVCGCGRVPCEIAFLVRTLSRVESGVFLYNVVSASIEN